MSKNIKRIISMILALGVISSSAPAANINFLITKAYASEDNDNDEDYLDSLDIYDEDGDLVKLYSNNDYTDKVSGSDVDEGETYYAKTSSDTVSIDIEGPKDKYVRVFNGTSSSSKGVEVGDDIKLSEDSATTTLTIKVYGEAPEDDMRYRDNDDYDVLSTYRVKVEYTGYDEETKSSNIFLERLSVDNNMIDLSSSKLSYTYNVDENVKEATIRATPEDDDYDVTIDDKKVYSSDNYKRTVNLDEGTNEFEIELEDGDKDRKYTLIINRGKPSTVNTSNSQSGNSEDYDNIYLDKMTLDGKLISLSKDIVNYSYSVPSYTDEVEIKAEPEKDNYTVKVNNEYVDESEDYKKTVHLLNGNNPIKIDVKNDNSGEERIYTLNVIRGTASATDTSSTQNNTSSGNKNNQWVQVNGAWHYNDASGNPVRNTWVQNYYLLDSGNMATGWLNYSGNWYYLGSDGARKTGWQLVDGIWYYLDSQGKIQTGWIKDSSGKYYYLNSYGAMVYNTIIDGYKLGADGAWIVK